MYRYHHHHHHRGDIMRQQCECLQGAGGRDGFLSCLTMMMRMMSQLWARGSQARLQQQAGCLAGDELPASSATLAARPLLAAHSALADLALSSETGSACAGREQCRTLALQLFFLSHGDAAVNTEMRSRKAFLQIQVLRLRVRQAVEACRHMIYLYMSNWHSEACDRSRRYFWSNLRFASRTQLDLVVTAIRALMLLSVP